MPTEALEESIYGYATHADSHRAHDLSCIDM